MAEIVHYDKAIVADLELDAKHSIFVETTNRLAVRSVESKPKVLVLRSLWASSTSPQSIPPLTYYAHCLFVRPVRPRSFIALITLLGWLFAFGHVLLEHDEAGGIAVHDAMTEEGHDSHHHDDDAPVDGEHHHEFAALEGSQWVKAADTQKFAPACVVLCNALVEQMVALLREIRKQSERPSLEHSPPDERASGWLLVIQTAHPVRGPSLVS